MEKKIEEFKSLVTITMAASGYGPEEIATMTSDFGIAAILACAESFGIQANVFVFALFVAKNPFAIATLDVATDALLAVFES